MTSIYLPCIYSYLVRARKEDIGGTVTAMRAGGSLRSSLAIDYSYGSDSPRDGHRFDLRTVLTIQRG
jgi:hypothetical protein